MQNYNYLIVRHLSNLYSIKIRQFVNFKLSQGILKDWIRHIKSNKGVWDSTRF